MELKYSRIAVIDTPVVQKKIVHASVLLEVGKCHC